jgi:hypothetical protein
MYNKKVEFKIPEHTILFIMDIAKRAMFTMITAAIHKSPCVRYDTDKASILPRVKVLISGRTAIVVAQAPLPQIAVRFISTSPSFSGTRSV